jgi:ABC-type transport system involved in multi-copper enzyme maturation permease subunit
VKLLAIFLFECRYQLRRPWLPLLFTALVGVTALFVRTNYVADQLYEDYLANAPFLLASATVFGGLLWLVTGGVVAGEAGARDVSTGMYPLTYTMPISKTAYLGGRFLAALTMNALLLVAVQLGILCAIYMPAGINVHRAPFRFPAYLTPYVFISLVNALATTAIQFALAVRSGRPTAAYFGSFLLFFTGFFISAALLFWQAWGALLDPIGIRFIVEDLGRQWTPVEKNVRLLSLEGVVLQNRLLWTGVAATTLAATYWRFRFAHRMANRLSARLRALRRRRPPQAAPVESYGTTGVPISSPSVPRAFGVRVQTRQALAIGWASFRYIATSWAGLVFFGIIPLLSVPVVVDQMESGGAPLIPVTALVITELTGAISDELSRWLVVPLLMIYFAGELVWRERDAAVSDITDTLPGSEWPPLLGKYLGLALALTIFSALLIVAGVVAQVMLGHGRHEIQLYLKTLLGLQLVEYLLFAGLALVVHVIVLQKYGAHLVLVIACLFMAMPALFGIEHHLLIYGAGPAWSYTEMRGFGPSLLPWLAFRLYWASWLLLLAVAARLLWVRGRETRVAPRLRAARQRFRGATALATAVGAGLVIGVGGVTFYNTNVLNPYVSVSAGHERRAEYERRYGRYGRLPQPQIVSTALRVEIHPERGAAEIRGRYRLLNNTSSAIAAIHIAPPPAVRTDAITLDRAAAVTLRDEELFHRVYVLERPLEAGDSLQLSFDVRVERRGFRHDGISDAVAENGTHLTNRWLPAIGYQPTRELISASDRREHGLPSRPVIAPAGDEDAAGQRGSGTTLDVLVGTRADQRAVAPGALQRTWTTNGRSYFHYVTDAPVTNEYSIFSARYAVQEATWRSRPDARPVAIRLVHHPGHSANLDSIMQSVQASLDYYTKNIGPYGYGHLTVVERAGNATGMHADASMITFNEGSALWKSADEPRALDFPFAVVAHEMAHQWTVPYAAVEGAPVLSEGVAWYYAMKTVEHAMGRVQLDELLHFMRQPHVFPPVRRGEPLLRGVDGYASYRRGPFALHALSRYGGTDAVNGALRRLHEAHGVPGAPLATMHDLYRQLQTALPLSLHTLLRDLFEVNAYWDLETERVSTHETSGGAWEVRLDIDARKVVYDVAGAEAAVPMDDLVQIGVFAGSEELYLRTHRLPTGKQTITVLVPREPDRAGVDPHHLLLEVERGDNVRSLAPRPRP